MTLTDLPTDFADWDRSEEVAGLKKHKYIFQGTYEFWEIARNYKGGPRVFGQIFLIVYLVLSENLGGPHFSCFITFL